MGVKCLPKFRAQGIKINGAVHPSLSEVMNNVVPNSLDLNEEERVLLLTGPNMGGKSTLLKQTCLLVILAQLGCFVPALEYFAPVFDQIFCRIGASDRILEGKSTFYVELEETKRIMNKAT
jgi:DNA mismatch repair ATPase MutS